MEMKTYFEELKTANKQRYQIKIPSIRMVIWFVSVLIVLVVILALIFAPRDEIDFHFRRERGVLTALSSIFLAIACGMAGSSFFLTDRENKTQKLFWFLVMLAFLFLSMDELMLWHEKWGRWIGKNWLEPPQIFRNWNDVVVILYGLGAIIFFAYFLPVILRYPKFIEILVIAFIFYMVHTGVDSFVYEKRVRFNVIEETCKIFSSGYFSIAMFVGLLGNVVNFSLANSNEKKF